MSNKLAVNSKNQDLSQAGDIVLLIIMRQVVFAILCINHWYQKPDAGKQSTRAPMLQLVLIKVEFQIFKSLSKNPKSLIATCKSLLTSMQKNLDQLKPSPL